MGETEQLDAVETEARGEGVAGEVVSETAVADRPRVDPAGLPVRLTEAIERRREARRHPVIPETVASSSARSALLRDLAGHGWYLARFHGVRLPVYAGRLVTRAPVGFWRVSRSIYNVVADVEERPLMQSAVKRDDWKEYKDVSRQHSARMRARGALTVALLAFFAVGGWALLQFLPGWVFWTWAALAVWAFGIYGQRADKPIVTRAVDMPVAFVRLTSEVIERALRALPIGGLGKGEIRFPAPIRDVSNGWVASVDLPAGITPHEVMKLRDKLASGLRRPSGCVWPDADIEAHGGRLELTVLKVPMNKAKQPAHPLFKGGEGDVFGRIAWGTDQRGRPVTVPVFEQNFLIGSLPGGGKTAAVRGLCAGCAMDKSVELHVWELKGSGDLESFERIAHAYGSGVDDETIEGALHGLRWLVTELARRSERLNKLRKTARHLVPDSKTTRELADRRLGLHPIVFVVDEAQELFSHEDYGAEAGKLATKVIKRGRALGVILVLATQRPDKDSLPTGVSDNVSVRFCLRVMGQVPNDMVLGTSSYQNGIRATTLTPSDKGIGYLVGASDEPTVTRTYYLDAAKTDAMVERAFALRDAAGLITGHAAGEDDVIPAAGAFDEHLGRVFAECTRDFMWSEDIIAELARLYPDIYSEWTPKALGPHMRALGIGLRQLERVGADGERRNRRGVTVADVEAALADYRRSLPAGAEASA